jgi:hypothetical protein
MGKTLWYVLGALAVYWYLIKKGTTAQLIDAVKGTASTGFSPINEAGQTTGAAADPGTHDSYPGATVAVPVKAYLLPSRKWYPPISPGATLPGGGPILRM